MKTKIYAVVMLSCGTMVASGSAFAQGDAPAPVDTKAGYGSAVASPQAGDAKTQAAAPDSAKGTVDVKLTEFKIEMPNSVSAGLTTFKVTNTGKHTHGFEIEGNGIEEEITPQLTKGNSGSLQVDLKPGTYKVYCPVNGHEGMGMSLTLAVK
ncbi:MAG TPA: cupredoxin domain-containing protein [Chthoniobacterales bacterium]|nr:cupredoxin domain-containing protein [Chthoniobacterales bacterium]